MIIERKESLTVLPVWDDKKIRRTRHFCGRAHASRFVERWIANPGMALIPDVLGEAETRAAGSARFDEDTAEQRKKEQLLMLDENGEETSSARIVPNRPSAEVPAIGLAPVPAPPACVLPPPLAHLVPSTYPRAVRMMSQP
jgi:hypothetical protein